jgi:hypothetical protein
VRTVVGYNLKTWDQIPDHIQNNLVAHSAFCPVVPGDLSPGVKHLKHKAGHSVLRLRMHRALPPLPLHAMVLRKTYNNVPTVFTIITEKGDDFMRG